ncbi:MAG: hypothetical protein A3A02_00345 [Candidatus Buchananbacteria bacterium RIFCSPLOWO2_01_FULL_39_33]|uniref:Uncharacterized protein n=1 Tax=Candidatus Buchananbacteria bacterium RIFCSPLOWO2_01_FULL_39_33 TaxID=1797543 RepID=A0A1G1YN80_9BACT|nr:MAG: hypothetical protein A3A02_00345 [Candidatus Buchananbacteria bacterium RIFCSPLOWO2_01_FULL_39_33]
MKKYLSRWSIAKRKRISNAELLGFTVMFIINSLTLIFPVALLILFFYREIGSLEPIVASIVISLMFTYLALRIYLTIGKKKKLFWIIYLTITFVLLSLALYITNKLAGAGL